MVKIKARNLYGYNVEESDIDPRVYDLPSGQHLIVGKKIGELEIILGTANNHKDEDHDGFFQTLNFATSLGVKVIAAVDSQFNGAHAKDAEKSLAARLSDYKEIVRSNFSTLYLGTFDEPEYVLLLSQCTDPKDFDSFLEKCLKIEQIGAQRSLEKNKPNYSLHAPYLVADISGYLGQKINIDGVPKVIHGFTPYGYAKTPEIDENYVTAIVQKNGSSFTYDATMQRQVRKLTNGLNDDLEKSKAIFEWIISNISYDKKKGKKSETNYRGALQTYKDKKGVCGESAALQVTMERLAGNMAFLTEIETGTVGKTQSGKIVNVAGPHACATHIRPNGEVFLIDTTNPEGFGIEYGDFRIISDEHSFAKY